MIPQRWQVLWIAYSVMVSMMIQWIVLSPVVETAGSYYGFSAAQVNLLPCLYYIALNFVGLPMAVKVQTFTIKQSLLLAASFNCAGATLRFLLELSGQTGFPGFCVAQLLCGVATCVSLPMPTRVSQVWFPSEERTLATAVSTTGDGVGVAFGILLPPFIVLQIFAGNLRAGFVALFAFHSLGSIVVLLLVLWVVPVHPDDIPTGWANAKSVVATAIAESCTHRNAWAVILPPAVVTGALWALGSLLPQVLGPSGLSESALGWLGYLTVLSGTIACVIMSRIVDRTHKFRFFLLGLSSIILLLFSALALAAAYGGGPVLVGAIYALMGTLQVTVLPIGMELLVEVTYPAPPFATSAVMIWVANMLAFLFTVPYLVSSWGPIPPLAFAISMVLLHNLSLVMLGLLDVPLKRRAADLEAAAKAKALA